MGTASLSSSNAGSSTGGSVVVVVVVVGTTVVGVGATVVDVVVVDVVVAGVSTASVVLGARVVVFAVSPSVHEAANSNTTASSARNLDLRAPRCHQPLDRRPLITHNPIAVGSWGFVLSRHAAWIQGPRQQIRLGRSFLRQFALSEVLDGHERGIDALTHYLGVEHDASHVAA